MGILPTYDQIGYVAVFILFLLRTMQGIAIVGEGVGALLFSMEHYTLTKDRAVIGAIISASSLGGCLFAALISSLILNSYNTISWNWRIPFLLGSFIGLFGVYLRKEASETPEFMSYTNKNKLVKHNPLLTLFKTNKSSFLISTIIVSIMGMTASLTTTFLNIYLHNFRDFALSDSLKIISFFISVYIATIIITMYVFKFVNVIIPFMIS